ncbi:Type VI secretion system (T6SS), amidase immunity protein [Pedobacter hartonius]|uniref:Type VI secretion system (T6SS), amidase immunity protein n=2 Tax=Pedobacter hartonius TaxID=425514 RepID=A0A1H4H5X2_9SPHI|nr:Type VI secretion system (T6SS), amidase immunity protein [Pedobacter hartonius]
MGILLYTGGCKVRKNEAMEAILKERRQWMKEYALCSCLSLVGKQDTAFRNDISQTVYVEITDYSRTTKNNLYNAVDSLAYKAFNSITPTQIADYEGKKPYMMSCIEFSQSEELDSLIRRYDYQIQNNP